MPSWYQWHDFLDPAGVEVVRRTVAASEREFIPAGILGGDPTRRRAHVLNHVPTVYNLVNPRLHAALPWLRLRLGDVVPEHVSEAEMQVTVHLDGDYLKTHTDNGHAVVASRKLSYVYYFQMAGQPPFTGGNLRLEVDGGEVRIAPIHNSLLVFPPGCYHEIEPVVGPTNFYGGRFTVNGWLRA